MKNNVGNIVGNIVRIGGTDRAIPAALLAVATLWCAILPAPPLLASAGHGIASTLVRLFFAPLCHQIPERSFHLMGSPIAVCARCMGCYAGLIVGLVIATAAPARFAVPPRARWIAVAIAPAALQWGAARAGGPDGNLLRSLTGGAIGLVIAFFIVPAMVALRAELRHRRGRRLIAGWSHAKAR